MALLRFALGTQYPRGLTIPNGGCPCPGPWARAHGSHLLCRFPGSNFRRSPRGATPLLPPRAIRPRPSHHHGRSALTDDTFAAEKARLRAAALARRDAFPIDRRESASLEIADRIVGLGFPDGATVSAFLPIRSEVDLRPAIARLIAAGHTIGLPVMSGPRLVFRRYVPDAPLVPLGFGTYGPGPDAPEVMPDVMLVPLSAYDRRGGRIGYGKGYYDTTIAGYRAAGHSPRLIGVAFSVQEVETVPMEPHDVPLPVIVTERTVVIIEG